MTKEQAIEELLPAGTILGETYRVARKIGEGGMGAVLKVMHIRLNKAFAAKVFLPKWRISAEAVTRFKQEAEFSGSLKHPNIIEVIDFNKAKVGEHEFTYIIMELLEGENLAARIARDTLDYYVVGEIVRQVTAAMAHAHLVEKDKKCIVHRDLKPENIFLTRHTGGLTVKVLDFGISKLLGQPADTDVTGERVLGSPSYMSPEQINSKMSVDHRSDIFSLGIVIFEMLTGQLPFPGDNLQEVLSSILMDDTPSLRDFQSWITPELEQVVRRALEKKPEDRQQSMEQLGQEFERALDSLEVTAVREIPLPTDGSPVPSTTNGSSPRFSQTLGYDELRPTPAAPEYLPRQKTPSVIPAGIHAATTADIPRVHVVSPEGSSPAPAEDSGHHTPSARIHRLMIVLGAVAAVALALLFFLVSLSSLFKGGSEAQVNKFQSAATAKVQPESRRTPDAKVVVTAIKPDPRPDAKVTVAVAKVPAKQVRPLPRPKPRPKPKVRRKVRRLKPVPAKKVLGSLRVVTMKGGEPFGGAKVYLSGRHIGYTPLVKNDLRVGTYRVKVTSGGATRTKRVTIGAKTRVIVEF
ncbi:MAG: serine/threonine-protein kinase [Parcubacteria group bacterium]